MGKQKKSKRMNGSISLIHTDSRELSNNDGVFLGFVQICIYSHFLALLMKLDEDYMIRKIIQTIIIK